MEAHTKYLVAGLYILRCLRTGFPADRLIMRPVRTDIVLFPSSLPGQTYSFANLPRNASSLSKSGCSTHRTGSCKCQDVLILVVRPAIVSYSASEAF